MIVPRLRLLVFLAVCSSRAALCADPSTLPLPVEAGRIESTFLGETREFKGGRRQLSLVMGENDFPTVISQNGALKEVIATSAPAGLTCRLAVLRGAGHVPANALVEGLRDLFDGWKPPKDSAEGSANRKAGG
ncbi:MAG: hypothetical protein IPP07_20775 [Holophagales bacterium]|jgi:hypothetical protein|nr:hypothetical protein [Holophagales bacterium]MBK9967179.1 hypothetical protein [Holophagales bacterium]